MSEENYESIDQSQMYKQLVYDAALVFTASLLSNPSVIVSEDHITTIAIQHAEALAYKAARAKAYTPPPANKAQLTEH